MSNDDSATGQNSQQTGRQKGRRQLLTMFAIAFVSLGGSYLAFYIASSGSTWGTTNHGAFVEPPTTTASVGLILPEDQADHWWLIIVADECGPQCEAAARDMRSLQVLLNKDANRVRRGIVWQSPATMAWMEEYTQLHALALGGGLPTGIYTVDPNGNLVLRYALDVNPKFVLEDLKKLLRVSQIG